MKKKTAGWIVAGLALAMLTGCAATEKAVGPEPPTVITVWTYYNGAQKESFDLLVQQFNETEGAQANIVVQAVSKGTIDELNQALNDSLEKKVGAEAPPQICAAYADNAFSINEKGLVANLDPYLTEAEQAEYVDAYLEEGRFGTEESLKLFPVAKSTEVLTVNMTDWEKFAAETGASLDTLKTWEGMAEVAEDYYAWSDGRAFFGRDALANYILIGSRQLGHQIFRVDDGQVEMDFDKETMRKLWDCFYVPYVKGYYTASGKFRSDDLKTGDLIAFVGSTSGAAYTPRDVTYEDGTNYEIRCQILPPPNFAGTEPSAVQQGAGMMVLASDEKTEAAAVTFLKWFTKEEQNLEFSLRSGYLPVKKEANTREALERVLKEGEMEVSEIMKESFQVGIQVVQDYDLYTTKAFAEGYQARTLLESSLFRCADEDRKTVEALIAGGMEPEAAQAGYLTDENFEAWYEDTDRRLKALGE